MSEDALDILVDMDGYSNEGLRRSELFTVRHAPVTVAWFVISQHETQPRNYTPLAINCHAGYLLLK